MITKIKTTVLSLLASTTIATAQTVEDNRDTVLVASPDTTITMPVAEARMLDVIDFEPADPNDYIGSSNIIDIEGEEPSTRKGFFTIEASGGLGMLSTRIEVDDNAASDDASDFAYRISADYVGAKGWGVGLAYAAWSANLDHRMPIKMNFVGPYLALRLLEESKWTLGITAGVGYGSVDISGPGWGGWSYGHFKKSGVAFDATTSLEYRLHPNFGLVASITADELLVKSDKRGGDYSDGICYATLMLGLRIHI